MIRHMIMCFLALVAVVAFAGCSAIKVREYEKEPSPEVPEPETTEEEEEAGHVRRLHHSYFRQPENGEDDADTEEPPPPDRLDMPDYTDPEYGRPEYYTDDAGTAAREESGDPEAAPVEEMSAPPGYGGAEDVMSAPGAASSGSAVLRSPRRPRVRPRPQPTVRAAAHDDNEEYLTWLEYMDGAGDIAGVMKRNYTDRVIVRIVDAEGRPVMNRLFQIETADRTLLWTGRTCANGECVVYPHAFFGESPADDAHLVLDGIENPLPWQPEKNGILTVELAEQRQQMGRVPVDIAFVMDATGSMGDEIQQLKDVLFSIHTRLMTASDRADLRFGLVAYRDRRDRTPLEVVPFTGDIDSFQVAIAGLIASGGGDYPEDLQNGLQVALDDLAWREGGIRAVFVVADAPPHTDYGQQQDYLWAAETAGARATRIHMIGASGLRPGGEYIFRQIAAASYGQFIFLTYGERSESSGAGTAADPGRVSHHTGENFTSRMLDDIVVDLIRKDLAYQVEIPILATDDPPPAAQNDMLSLRMDNLWGQICRQIAATGQDSLTAVLLPFENGLPDTSLCRYLRDLSTEKLVGRETLVLVERDRLDAVLSEQNLSVSGLTATNEMVELGNLLNSRLLLLGRVYRLGTDRVMHVRAVDIETARVIAAARVRV